MPTTQRGSASKTFASSRRLIFLLSTRSPAPSKPTRLKDILRDVDADDRKGADLRPLMIVHGRFSCLEFRLQRLTQCRGSSRHIPLADVEVCRAKVRSCAERAVCGVLTFREDRLQLERPRGGGEKEVLRHLRALLAAEKPCLLCSNSVWSTSLVKSIDLHSVSDA